MRDARRVVRAGVAIAVAAAVAGGWAPRAEARLVDVSPSLSDSVDALGAAFAVAQPGDTLMLGPGVYRGSHVVPHGVSLVGRAGPDSTILDAVGERWVLLGLDLDRTSVIAGLTLRHGRRAHANSGGGGLHLRGSSPLVVGNVFEDHLGYLGAGLWAFQGSRPIVAHNVFRRCEGHLGGAVSAYVDSDLLLWNNVFYDNVAVSGGAVLCMQSSPVIMGNTMLRNRADLAGGSAIYGADESRPLVEGNVLAFHRGSPAVVCLNADSVPTLRGNLLWENDGEVGGACPAFAEADGNCREDPGFPPSEPQGLRAQELRAPRRDGSCAPRAGARAMTNSTSAIPDSVLETWRAWVAAHARDPAAAQDVGLGPSGSTAEESGRKSSPKIRNSTR